MQKKLNKSIFVFFFIFAMLSSCEESEKTKPEDENVKLLELKSYLHNLEISNESIFVWRRGSISWSTLGSLIVLTPVRFDVRKTKLDYYIIYGKYDNSIKSYTNYSFITKDLNLYYSILNELNLKEKKNLIKENQVQSEGITGNSYYIEIHGDTKRIVNCKSNFRIRNVIFKLFSKVSPSEHYQSLSLKSCDFNQVINNASNLYFGRNKKDKFLIPYNEFIPSFNGKQLEMKILENGDTIYIK